MSTLFGSQGQQARGGSAAGGENVMQAYLEDRLLGKLALADTDRAVCVLLVRLDTKEVLFGENVAEPQVFAKKVHALYDAVRALDNGPTGPTGSTDATQPLFTRIEGPAATQRYRAIYSDGTYLLYAEVERSHR